MHSNFRVLRLLSLLAFVASAAATSAELSPDAVDDDGDIHPRPRTSLMRKALGGASALEISDAGRMSSAGNRSLGGSSASTGPSGACCMREKVKYQVLPVTQHNHTPGIARSKIVFMCKNGATCPNKWTPVAGHFCTGGFKEGITAGLTENAGNGFTSPSSCDAATAGTANTETDEDDVADNDPNSIPIAVCCVHMNAPSGSKTKVRFECKQKACSTSNGWREAPGDHCVWAFKLAQQAGMTLETNDAFCKGFDGHSDVTVNIRRRRSTPR